MRIIYVLCVTVFCLWKLLTSTLTLTIHIHIYKHAHKYIHTGPFKRKLSVDREFEPPRRAVKMPTKSSALSHPLSLCSDFMSEVMEHSSVGPFMKWVLPRIMTYRFCSSHDGVERLAWWRWEARMMALRGSHDGMYVVVWSQLREWNVFTKNHVCTCVC